MPEPAAAVADQLHVVSEQRLELGEIALFGGRDEQDRLLPTPDAGVSAVQRQVLADEPRERSSAA